MSPCPWSRVSPLLFVLTLAVAAGCNGGSAASDAAAGDAADAAIGGPVLGALDQHCAAVPVVVVNPAACDAVPMGGGDEEPAVLYNASGDDDDCKYHITFTTTPVTLNQNVTFKVTVTALAPDANKAPVTGAELDIEGSLGALHVLPNNGTVTSESPAGTYTVGPVKFDARGQWVVRFHLFEDCTDLPESPHGHVGFYLNVP
jgi:hypothetical protein